MNLKIEPVKPLNGPVGRAGGLTLSSATRVFRMLFTAPAVVVTPTGPVEATILVPEGVMVGGDGGLTTASVFGVIRGRIDISISLLLLAQGLVNTRTFRMFADPLTMVGQSLQLILQMGVNAIAGRFAFLSGIRETAAPAANVDPLTRIADLTGDQKSLSLIRDEEKQRTGDGSLFDRILQKMFAVILADVAVPRLVVVSLDDSIFEGRGAPELRLQIVKAIRQVRLLQEQDPNRKTGFVFVYSGTRFASLSDAAAMFGIPEALLKFTNKDPEAARRIVETEYKDYAVTVITTPSQSSIWSEFMDMMVGNMKNVSQILTLGEQVILQGVDRAVFEQLNQFGRDKVNFNNGILTIEGISAGVPSAQEEILSAELLAQQA